MSAVAQQAQAPEMPTLTRRDLRAFDTEALALVMRAQDYGWRGRMGTNGHVFMRAPDGVATMSVTRSSLRGRSGRNAKAELERWIKANPQYAPDSLTSHPAGEPAAPGAAFGAPAPVPEADWDPGVLPAATLIEVRRQGVAQWLLDNPQVQGTKLWEAWAEPEVDPHRWYVVDLRGDRPKVIGRGKNLPEQEMQQMLRARHPRMFKGEPRVVREHVNMQGGNTMRVMLCDYEGCEYRTDHAGALNLHRKKHEPVEIVTCPHPGCGREMAKTAMPQHARSHADNAPTRCPRCGKVLVGQRGLSSHLTRSHPGIDREVIAHAGEVPVARPVVTGDTPVADGAVTVTSPVGDVTGGGVLNEYLEHVPEGADAEAQVAAVRAIVAAPLVAEMRRLRADNERLELQVKELTDSSGELQAKISLMREALGL
jgi:hypothetical protein